MPIGILAYCLMPNHFHLVVRPIGDGDLSRWMQWFMTAHVRRYLTHYHHSGHIWQGRFKAFPIQDDGHLLAVLRYVERNALRANLVLKAEDWPWSSLHPDASRRALRIKSDPELRPPDWIERVNTAMSEAEEEAIRVSIRRGKPLGSESWVLQTAERLSLGYTLRQRGRPRKPSKNQSNSTHIS